MMKEDKKALIKRYLECLEEVSESYYQALGLDWTVQIDPPGALPGVYATYRRITKTEDKLATFGIGKPEEITNKQLRDLVIRVANLIIIPSAGLQRDPIAKLRKMKEVPGATKES